MKIIGIDLGTTNSAVALYEAGKIRILNIDGRPTVPSVVYRHKGESSVGDKAKKRLLIYPERVLSSTKRNIGTQWSQTVDGEKFTATEAAREILIHLKREIETQVGEKVTQVVVTVPAYFNDAQRRETKVAAEAAGFQVLRLLPEPTAAAIAYGLDKEKDQTILVFDLGGGTFDVSILEVRGNQFTVKAVDGNSNLGGDDFDQALVNHLNDCIEEQYSRSLRGNKQAQQKLREAAEEAKITLSSVKRTDIAISGLAPGIDLDLEGFSRAKYEALIQPYLEEMIAKTKATIQQADLSLDDISRIVLVGGSCKTPLVAQTVKEHFRQPFQADDMDTYVARGAAIACASLTKPQELENRSLPVDLTFKDVISHSLGTDLIDSIDDDRLMFVPILKKNSPYPNRGAILAYTVSLKQTIVKFRVLRGEHHDPDKNDELGELELPIDQKYAKDHHIPVSAIYELDHNGILHFTAVEIPPRPALLETLGKLDREAQANNQIIPIEMLDNLVAQNSLTTRDIIIQSVLN